MDAAPPGSWSIDGGGADFSCSTHVRRMPNGMEGGLDPLALVDRRVAELRARSSAFARRVRDGS